MSDSLQHECGKSLAGNTLRLTHRASKARLLSSCTWRLFNSSIKKCLNLRSMQYMTLYSANKIHITYRRNPSRRCRELANPAEKLVPTTSHELSHCKSRALTATPGEHKWTCTRLNWIVRSACRRIQWPIYKALKAVASLLTSPWWREARFCSLLPDEVQFCCH